MIRPTFRIPLVISVLATACDSGTASVTDDVPEDTDGGNVAVSQDADVRLRAAGSFRADPGTAARAAEIVAFDATTRRLLVTNKVRRRIDVVDIADPDNPTLATTYDVSPYGKHASSVAASGGVIAVTVVQEPRNLPGRLVLFDASGARLADVGVGAAPDMVTFTPDGKTVIVADEGEPSEDYTVDPEGSVTFVDLSGGAASVTQDDVETVTFGSLTVDDLGGARVYGPGASIAQDLEPEYVAVSDDGTTAWVTLQENNALAVYDVASRSLTEVRSLGTKDHSRDGAGFDASDQDGKIDIATHPARGMYMPDGVEAFEVGGKTYLLTANEGGARSWTGFDERVRVGSAKLDPGAFPNAAALKDPAALGRLRVSITGDDDGDGDLDRLLTFGGRSFTVWKADGTLVWDSGDRFEKIIANSQPQDFNSDSVTNGTFDQRSDDAGPEPENVVVGAVGQRLYAFVAMERMSGVMVFEVTDPTAPSFVQYVNTRNFAGDPLAGTAGDLGPEGMVFVPAADSPIDLPLLAVSYEGSGTTTLFVVEPVPEEAP